MTENPPARAWKVTLCGQTDLGRQRTNNEDNLLVVDLDRASPIPQNETRVHDVGAKGTLLIVADGMGGANAGEVASQMAVEVISRQITATWSDGGGQVPEEMLPQLIEAVKASNREIKAKGMEDDSKRGMGSTCVVAGIIPGRALLCNVGDSRGYLCRGSECTQLTHDQSFVQHLLDVGAITKDQAARSPRRNVVMEALGAREEVNVAQVTPLELQHGDVLVLCSDGLTGHVEDEEIIRVVYSTTDAKERCKRLIELANERGGKDNITVIVAEVEVAGEAPAVRPVLPPLQPKPPELPPDVPAPEPPPPPMQMSLAADEPLDADDGDLGSQGREYSLATGFILGLSVGLVAAVVFLGEHLRTTREEIEKSYRQELAQKDAAVSMARLEAERKDKIAGQIQRGRQELEASVGPHLIEWKAWEEHVRSRVKDLPRAPRIPQVLADIAGIPSEPDETASPSPAAPPSPEATPDSSPEPAPASPPASPEPPESVAPASPEPPVAPVSPESPASPAGSASPAAASAAPAAPASPEAVVPAPPAPGASPVPPSLPPGAPASPLPATPPRTLDAPPSPAASPAVDPSPVVISPGQPPSVAATPAPSPSPR